MISYEDIRDVHLEISTLCNAACPWCPRNFWGYPHNNGYPEVSLSLPQSKKIFSPDFLRQLSSIRINGNFGDIVMNTDGADIVEYFREHNKKLQIHVSTNGAARDPEFWQRLARANCEVSFGLDGLGDTHKLYRQNTQWSTVIRNAKFFIDAGGAAIWKMIKFKHNLHQVKECRELSKTLGFQNFELIDHGRDTAPVFNKHGKLTHVLGDYRGETEFNVLFQNKKHDTVLIEDITSDRVPKTKILCETKKLKSIYIAANGDVSPCCWIGHFPQTYGKGQYHEAINSQLVPLIYKNNALEYPLQECIDWFVDIEKSWKIGQYSDGRLIVCDDNCGT